MGDKITEYEKAIINARDVIPIEHLEWLINLPLYHEEEKYFFVHAGLVPGITIEEHKSALEKGDKDYEEQMIWIRDEFIDTTYDWGKKIVYGHTPVKKPFFMENKIGIDTMTRSGGILTALFLPEEKTFQTDPTEGVWW